MSVPDHIIVKEARLLTQEHLTPADPSDASSSSHAEGQENPPNAPPTGRWELTELEDRLSEKLGIEIDLRPSREPFRSILASGEVVRFEGGRYTEYTTRVEGMTRLSLLDLIRKAEETVDPAHEARRGSQAADDRRVEKLTASQFRHIRTACNRLGRHLGGERRSPDEDFHSALTKIGSEYFVWDPDAGRRSQGDWLKLLDLVRAASPDSSTSQYVGSVRRLMDLAATHGWIGRTPAHDRNYAPVPADWAPLYNQWRKVLLGRIDQLKVGLMALFEACYRHDQESPVEADWEEIVRRLEERFAANGVPSHERTVIRRTYRAARAADLLTGPEWDGRRYQQREAAALVPAGDRFTVAHLYGRDGPQRAITEALRGIQVAWPGEWSGYPGVVDGSYGLRGLLEYQTVPPSKAEELGVPDRGLYPREPIRGTSARSDKGWTKGTLQMRLEEISHCAGWMAREYDIDWSTEDLSALFREDRLRGYKSYLEDVCDGGIPTYINRFGTLARIASPYLEWRAIERGDEGLADRFAHLSKLISSPNAKVDGGKSWLARWRSEKNEDQVAELRRIAKLVERTWTRSGRAASCAYIQLRRVLGESLALFEEDYGPLTDQVAAVHAGADRVSIDDSEFQELDRRWARTVRDLVYWADQVIVPLRVNTSVRLDRSDRIEDPGFTHLRARIRESKRKTSTPEWFRPNYYRGNGYPVDLYRLYVMPGGARERLLTLPNGKVVQAGAHYVHDLQGQAKRARKSADTFRNLTGRVVGRLLERRPHVLSPDLDNPITFEELNEPSHVLATHMFRHAYARYWVREQGDLQTAAAYLDHKDHSMLLEVYLGEDESDLDPAQKMAELPGG